VYALGVAFFEVAAVKKSEDESVAERELKIELLVETLRSLRFVLKEESFELSSPHAEERPLYRDFFVSNGEIRLLHSAF